MKRNSCLQEFDREIKDNCSSQRVFKMRLVKSCWGSSDRKVVRVVTQKSETK